MKMTLSDLLSVRHGSPWCCTHGHIMGVAISRRTGGRWQTQLLLFRNAAQAMSDVIEINALVVGTVHDIVCSACDTPVMRTWHQVKGDHRQ